MAQRIAQGLLVERLNHVALGADTLLRLHRQF